MSRALAESKRIPGDAYYTPDSLAVACVAHLPIKAGDHVLEPHAGGGAFVRALLSRGCTVDAQDVSPDATGLSLAHRSSVGDFLERTSTRAKWVIGNPPYRQAEEHIRHALSITERHVVFLLRLALLESQKRAPLWAETPLRKVFVLQKRPSFTGGGTDSAAYGLFWWDKQWSDEGRIGWLKWPISTEAMALAAAPVGQTQVCLFCGDS